MYAADIFLLQIIGGFPLHGRPSRPLHMYGTHYLYWAFTYTWRFLGVTEFVEPTPAVNGVGENYWSHSENSTFFSTFEALFHQLPLLFSVHAVSIHTMSASYGHLKLHQAGRHR